MLRKAELRKSIHGIRINRGSPPVSHLLFADDTMVFCKASRKELEHVSGILRDYRNASGQLINLQKSAMFFSKNTGPILKSELSALMAIPVRTDLGRYLGLSAENGKSKTELFNYIKDKVLMTLPGWKEKLINQAGKEVLLLSVALALPTYAMACFRLPEGLCYQIEDAMARLWWGSKSCNDRKIHWMKWSKLCKEKFKGGLGFRSLTDYNLALLAKQGWHLMVSPKCLMARVMKSKYFKDCDFMESRLGSNPSWASSMVRLGFGQEEQCRFQRG
ncbi:hypothetical protein RHSIM_Rhsim01G0011800 [Rhododendron simsii]|uniref:Reverse transcriptase domain-containing protein n=1 Tax=Rhododendron simsii TaxID=118357 RepID=A0A834HT41_RHOSS|nr:hypothetical protein RHSIM_Rhsim01G0011800 [Rhododendron simsii]